MEIARQALVKEWMRMTFRSGKAPLQPLADIEDQDQLRHNEREAEAKKQEQHSDRDDDPLQHLLFGQDSLL